MGSAASVSNKELKDVTDGSNPCGAGSRKKEALKMIDDLQGIEEIDLAVRRGIIESLKAPKEHNLTSETGLNSADCAEDLVNLISQSHSEQLSPSCLRIDLNTAYMRSNLVQQHDVESEHSFEGNIGGESVRITSAGLTMAGHAGKRGLSAAQNQDCFFVIEDEATSTILYGVMDGHGTQGHFVSNFVKNYFEENLVRSCHFSDDIGASITETVASCEQALTAYECIDSMRSGITLTVVAIRDKVLTVANVGDTRVVLVWPHHSKTQGDEEEDASPRVMQLSRDHKPDRRLEAKRIQKMGGYICRVIGGKSSYRVYRSREDLGFGIALSRSIGDDILADVGVISTPEILTYNVESMFTTKGHVDTSFQMRRLHLVLGSNHLFDFMPNTEIAAMCTASEPEFVKKVGNETINLLSQGMTARSYNDDSWALQPLVENLQEVKSIGMSSSMDVIEENGLDISVRSDDSRSSNGDGCRAPMPAVPNCPRPDYVWSPSRKDWEMPDSLDVADVADVAGENSVLRTCEGIKHESSHSENPFVALNRIQESASALLYTAFNRSIFNKGKSDDITVVHVCIQMG